MTSTESQAPAARVLLVHADAEMRRLVTEAFKPPDFEVILAERVDSACSRIPIVHPTVVLVGVEPTPAHADLAAAARRLDPPAVLIVLVPPGSQERLAELLQAGADDCLSLRMPPATLALKVQALLRLMRRMRARWRDRQVLGGLVGREGTLPLVKHCEVQKLSGKLTVRSGRTVVWGEFLGGELVRAGGSETAPGVDHLSALLDIREGSYVIQQRPLSPLGASSGPVPEALSPVEAPATPEMPEAPETPEETEVAVPEGCQTRVEAAPHQVAYEIETKGENRPNYTVTTIVKRGGEIVQRAQTAWTYPLRRHEDWSAARQQIEGQHARLTASIRELASQSPASTAPPVRGVDATLLSWAIHFLVEQGWTHLGTTIAVNLLRRTHANVAERRPILRRFRVDDSAHVNVDLAEGAILPAEAVEAVAEWLAEFLTFAERVVPDVASVNVRQATLLMADALDQVGFYAAFEKAKRAAAMRGPASA
jgi:hypothetical protein